MTDRSVRLVHRWRGLVINIIYFQSTNTKITILIKSMETKPYLNSIKEMKIKKKRFGLRVSFGNYVEGVLK